MDDMIEAARVAIEVDHRYRPAPLSGWGDEALEKRYCECGAGFLTADAHRAHVYAQLIDAVIRTSATYEYATMSHPEWGIDSIKTPRATREIAWSYVSKPRAAAKAVVRRPVLRLDWEFDDVD